MHVIYIVDGDDLDYFPTVGMIFAFDGPSVRSIADNVRMWISDKPPNEWPDSIWIFGKGYLAWWNTQINLVDMVPSSQSTLMFVEADPATDIMLSFLLNLNTVFGQAAMAPLLLAEHVKDVPLSKSQPKIWT